MGTHKNLVYLLILILVVISLGQIMIAYINPESYFFGIKLGGKPAAIYLLANSLVDIVIVYFLLKNLQPGIIASFLYFGYSFIESATTSLVIYHKFSLPVIPALGLVLSVLIVLSKKKYKN
ncbi:MAG: hypothetical protein WA130_11760 [Candidatus Methanoperedens sp.]